MRLQENTVHIWRINLDSALKAQGDQTDLLTLSERARAERLYFEKDRNRFIAARSLLRRLLGAYLLKDPRSLTLNYNRFGKPHLLHAPTHLPLEFNLSHSHGEAVFAFCLHRRIGVDLEHIRTQTLFDNIARRYFSPEEAEIILREGQKGKPIVFFRTWTLKEAFIKAQGSGLSYPLNKFSVSWKDSNQEVQLKFTPPSESNPIWHLQFLKTDSDFIGALAVEGSEPHIEYRKFDLNAKM